MYIIRHVKELTFHTPKPMAAKLRAIKSNLGAIVSTLGSLNGSKTAKRTTVYQKILNAELLRN